MEYGPREGSPLESSSLGEHGAWSMLVVKAHPLEASSLGTRSTEHPLRETDFDFLHLRRQVVSSPDISDPHRFIEIIFELLKFSPKISDERKKVSLDKLRKIPTSHKF